MGNVAKLLVKTCVWIEYTSQFNVDFTTNYDAENDEGYFLEVDIQYPEKLHELDNDLLFLPERMKIEKVEKLVSNLHDKTEHFIRIRNLKQVLNHGLILESIQRVIKFNQNAWLKPYIDMNTKLRKEAENNLEKDFFKLINNPVFGKTIDNARKYRDLKLVTTERRRNYVESELNYHTTKFFTENLLAVEMKKNLNINE